MVWSFEDVATALVAVAAVPAWAFVVLYPVRTRGAWQHSPEGRHLLSFTLVIALFLTLALTVRVFGPYPGRQVVAVALYGATAYLLWRRLVLMLQATRRR